MWLAVGSGSSIELDADVKAFVSGEPRHRNTEPPHASRFRILAEALSLTRARPAMDFERQAVVRTRTCRSSLIRLNSRGQAWHRTLGQAETDGMFWVGGIICNRNRSRRDENQGYRVGDARGFEQPCHQTIVEKVFRESRATATSHAVAIVQPRRQFKQYMSVDELRGKWVYIDATLDTVDLIIAATRAGLLGVSDRISAEVFLVPHPSTTPAAATMPPSSPAAAVARAGLSQASGRKDQEVVPEPVNMTTRVDLSGTLGLGFWPTRKQFVSTVFRQSRSGAFPNLVAHCPGLPWHLVLFTSAATFVEGLVVPTSEALTSGPTPSPPAAVMASAAAGARAAGAPPPRPRGAAPAPSRRPPAAAAVAIAGADTARQPRGAQGKTPRTAFRQGLVETRRNRIGLTRGRVFRGFIAQCAIVHCTAVCGVVATGQGVVKLGGVDSDIHDMSSCENHGLDKPFGVAIVLATTLMFLVSARFGGPLFRKSVNEVGVQTDLVDVERGARRPNATRFFVSPHGVRLHVSRACHTIVESANVQEWRICRWCLTEGRPRRIAEAAGGQV